MPTKKKKTKSTEPKPPKPVRPTELKEGSIVCGRYNGVFYHGINGELVDFNDESGTLRALTLSGLWIVQRLDYGIDDEECSYTGPEFFVPPKHLFLHEDDPDMQKYETELEAYQEEYGYGE